MWHKACILVKVYADKIWQATQEKAQNKDSATKRLSHQAVATLVQATCAGAMGGSRPIECAILVVLASLLTRKQVRRIHNYSEIYWDTLSAGGPMKDRCWWLTFWNPQHTTNSSQSEGSICSASDSKWIPAAPFRSCRDGQANWPGAISDSGQGGFEGVQ